MASIEITFKQEGTGYLSDPIEVTGSAVAVRMELSEGGETSLERSITGDNFLYECTITSSTDKRKSLEFNISGCIPGQQLRIRFGNAVPSKIYVLQYE